MKMSPRSSLLSAAVLLVTFQVVFCAGCPIEKCCNPFGLGNCCCWPYHLGYGSASNCGCGCGLGYWAPFAYDLSGFNCGPCNYPYGCGNCGNSYFGRFPVCKSYVHPAITTCCKYY